MSVLIDTASTPVAPPHALAGNRILKILIAEDDPTLRTVLSKGLSLSGHEVETVLDGLQAIDRLGAESFDVFITDWMMPGKDGLDVVRYLRSKIAHQPGVVVLSGLTQSEAKAHAMSAGADAYLCKPAPMSAVFEAVKAASRREVPSLGVASSASKRLVMAHPVWTNFQTTVAALLHSATGMKLAPSTVKTSAEDCKIVASLGMLDVEAGLELHYFLRTSLASGMRLSRTMFPTQPATTDLVDDLLVECCNLLLGTAKRVLRSSHFQFTLAVPRGSVMPVDFSAQSRSLFEGDGIRVVAGIGLRAAKIARVPTTALRANMILAEDVKIDSGEVVASAGTRITTTGALDLANHVGDRPIRVSVMGG